MNNLLEQHQLLWPVSGQGSSLCSMFDDSYRFEPRTKAFCNDWDVLI